MALGALTLPSVSTGFSSDSKAMVPVSIQGMADKVQRMSPIESMEEVFFDVRDGIVNLKETFINEIGNLGESLRLSLYSIEMRLVEVANISARDLGLEEIQTNIDKENEEDEERDESLSGGDKPGKSINDILSTLRESFTSLGELLAPKSDIAKVGLLGLLALGIGALLPKIEDELTALFTFLGETLLPALESIFDVVDDETGEFKWDKILGIGLTAYVAGKLAPLLLGLAFRVPGGATVIGYTGLAVWAAVSVFQAYGDTVAAMDWTEGDGATDSKLSNAIGGFFGGKLKGGIINAMRNASKFGGMFAAIGATIGLLGGPIGVGAGALLGGFIGIVFGALLGWIGGGKIANAVDNSMKAIDKAWEEGNIVGILDLAFGVFYDNVIAKIFKGVNYIFGGILKLSGLTELGQQIQDYEYSWDGLKEEISTLFDQLSIMLKDSVVNLVNFFLPKSLEIGATDNQQIETYNSMEAFKQNKPELFEPGGEMFEDYEAQKRIINNIDPSLLKSELVPMNDFEKDFGANANVGDIIDGTYKMKEKTVVIKTLESDGEKAPPGNVTIMTGNNNKAGDSIAVSQTYATGVNVNSSELTANAVLDYYSSLK